MRESVSGKVYDAYPEYKEVSSDWIREIPKGWINTPVKMVSDIHNGATPKSGETSYWDGDVSWVTPADLGKRKSPYISVGQRSITKSGYESCGTTFVPANSIILSSRAPIGTLGIAENELCTNQGCKSLVVKGEFNYKYLYYALLISTTQLNLLGRGTTFLELSADELGAYQIPNPSVHEQQQIASFLDHETAKIDTLIEKKQQLIRLLKEKRQAVISHAVTKGLNPDAPMKNSGVEWLGEVPEYYDVYKLKHACSEIFLGLTSKVDYVDSGGVPLVRALNIAGGMLNLSNAKEISLEQHKKLTQYRRAKRHDVLLSKSGTIGTAAIVDTDAEFSIYESIFALRAIEHLLEPEYLLFYIQSDVAKAQYARDSVGMGVHHLNMPDIEDVRIPIPPLKDQIELISYLKNTSKKFDALTEKASNSIALMKERRTALISAAVTGKIDVRNWQPENQSAQANAS
ncbi:restriction endonuclease subunit S [Neptuniibacter sp. QD48_11]|uniref:restriction endonuclease subunit S n=1 Tax=Neptuniibacter sp. QD48_11 TaxID=3398211 RepID=UPI0039F52F3B